MIDMRFLYAAFAIMFIIFIREILRRYYNFDMDNVDKEKIKALFKSGFKPVKKQEAALVVINRSSGDKNLVLSDCGTNKATVMATLRQITGLDYKSAKTVVDSTPYMFMTNVSDKEADLTKKALEFVGAKVEVK